MIKATHAASIIEIETGKDVSYLIRPEILELWKTSSLPRNVTHMMAIQEVKRFVESIQVYNRRKESPQEYIDRYMFVELNYRFQNARYADGFLLLDTANFKDLITAHVNKKFPGKFEQIVVQPLGCYGILNGNKKEFIMDVSHQYSGRAGHRDITLRHGDNIGYITYNHKYLSSSVIRKMAETVRTVKMTVGNAILNTTTQLQ